MSSRLVALLDDLLALVGLGCLIAGVYLWLGLAAALIVLGPILIYTGARIDIKVKRDESN